MAALVTVLCVLKGGGEYQPRHAARLHGQFQRHAPPKVEFLCLTDLVEDVSALGVPATALVHGWPGSSERLKRFNIWPGFWSKIEVYRTPGPCLYLDLDVTVVGDLAPMLSQCCQHQFVACADFWVGGPHAINSSVLGWSGDVSDLYHGFAAAPKAYMDVYQTMENWGDQGFVRDHWHGERVLWQDLLPGAVVSFKLGALKGEDLSRAIVVVSHGRPKPWEPDGADAWLRKRGRLL